MYSYAQILMQNLNVFMHEFMEWVERENVLIQTGLSFLSLIATVAISFWIYWLQRKHEMEIERMQAKDKQDEISMLANLFLINNSNELKFLSLCPIACKVFPNGSNVGSKRKIYKNFRSCSEEVQKKILEICEIQTVCTTDDAISYMAMNRWLKFLVRDIEKYDLGFNILGTGEKQFRRAIDSFYDYPWPEIVETVPCFPDIRNPDHSHPLLWEPKGIDFELYLISYLEYRKDPTPWKNLEPIFKPLDWAWYLEIQYDGNNMEILEAFQSSDSLCAWALEVICAVSRQLLKQRNEEEKLLTISLSFRNAETYEDKILQAIEILANLYIDEPLSELL